MKRITLFVTLFVLWVTLGALTGCQPINTAWTSPLLHEPPTAPPPYFLNPAAADQPLAAYRITYESIWSPHMVNGMAAEENLLIQAGYRQTTGTFPFDAYTALDLPVMI